jgi:hypothetical protein
MYLLPYQYHKSLIQNVSLPSRTMLPISSPKTMLVRSCPYKKSLLLPFDDGLSKKTKEHVP